MKNYNDINLKTYWNAIQLPTYVKKYFTKQLQKIMSIELQTLQLIPLYIIHKLKKYITEYCILFCIPITIYFDYQ